MVSYFFFEESGFMALCVLAFWLGDREQRALAGALMFQFAICALVVFGLGVKQRLSLAPPITDAALAVAAIALLLSNRKLWPVFFAGFQIAELVIDTRILLGVASFDYQTVTYAVICGWLVLVALLAGVIFENDARSLSKAFLAQFFLIGGRIFPAQKSS